MIVIHYPTAFKALDTFIDSFNAKIDCCTDRIKSGVTATAKEIIRIYGFSLLKANGCKEIDPKNLPSLQTNNKQLAKAIKCSTRTIQRNIIKLKAAGIIASKIFHGSNSNYELFINPEILLVTHKLTVEKTRKAVLEAKEAALRKESGSVDSKIQTPNCPHTYTNITRTINNIIIPVDNPAVKKENQGSLPLTGFIKKIMSCQKNTGDITGDTGKIVKPDFEKQNSVPGEISLREKNNDTGKIDSRAEDPAHLNVTHGTARDNFHECQIEMYTNLFWLMARRLLYKNTDLTERQIEIAKSLIKKFYEPSTKESIGRFHSMYIKRIAMVHQYLKKDSTRYVQLPYKYFDLKNEWGFIGTKKWYLVFLKRQNEVEKELTLKKLIRKFSQNNFVETHKRIPILKLFIESENTLGKLGGQALVNSYHAAVLNPEVYQNIRIQKKYNK